MEGLRIGGNLESTVESIIKRMESLGMSVYKNDSRDFNINVVAVRSPVQTLDKFSDEMFVFWKYKGAWKAISYEITTLPGSHYLINKLLSPLGAAIAVADMQYKKTYKIDLHGGKYPALCQRGGDVKVYRDNNKDRVFDMTPESIQTGRFGINIHAFTRPRDSVIGWVAEKVYNASAGCQVFKSISGFLSFMHIVKKSCDIYGPWVTFTILDGKKL